MEHPAYRNSLLCPARTEHCLALFPVQRQRFLCRKEKPSARQERVVSEVAAGVAGAVVWQVAGRYAYGRALCPPHKEVIAPSARLEPRVKRRNVHANRRWQA